jgi:hypothetical protein
VRADQGRFENGLLAYGWLDAHRSQYAQDRYRLARRRCFAVRDGFPRLVPYTVPLGVSGVSYTLDVSSCASCLVGEDTVRDALAQGVAMAGGAGGHAR